MLPVENMPSTNVSAVSTISGIDVSRYQQKIDWAAVAQSGTQFCFIKATEGARDVDPMFKSHWNDVAKAGLIRGAYHFFRPQIPVSAQVELFARTLGQYQPGDLSPACDFEGTAGWSEMPAQNRTVLALSMLEAVEKRFGVTPIVYTSPWFAGQIISNAPALGRFPIWIAQYTLAQAPNVPKPWNSWTFWQYTQNGKVPGISGFVDLNRFQGTLDELKALTHAKSAT